MSDQPNPVLVEAWRGPAVESMHRGAMVIVDARGDVVASLGDVERRVFPRSAIKLLQALPLVASGAADHWQLSDDELALACASHNGEDMHVTAAQSMLRKAGLDDDVLECGAHEPYLIGATAALRARGLPARTVHNNCSGKHAGFVCLGAFRALLPPSDTPDDSRDAARGYLRGYVGHDHKVMHEVNQAIAATTGFDPAQAARATDGCSIPTYALPLRALARGFAFVAAGEDPAEAAEPLTIRTYRDAARRLRRAIARAPFMVAGTDRFDTVVMQRLGERVCCKVGAEGVYAAALPEHGWGVAVKMDDGNTARAAEVVMACVIEHCVTLTDEERAFVHARSHLQLRNWNGIEVGALSASRGLIEAVARARPLPRDRSHPVAG
jgi:L-asparaginase II